MKMMADTDGAARRRNNQSGITGLSLRQIECLALVFERLQTKEIAIRLRLRPGTVDSYISTAITALGARSRWHAAEIVRSSLAAGDLEKFGFQSPWVEVPTRLQLPPEQPKRHLPIAAWLPVRKKGESGNDLSKTARVLAIAGLIVGFATAFGMLAAAVRTFSDLLRPVFD